MVNHAGLAGRQIRCPRTAVFELLTVNFCEPERLAYLRQ
jgi:hypothetical protein